MPETGRIPDPGERAPSSAPGWPRTIRLRDGWTVTERIAGTGATVVIKSAEATDPTAPDQSVVEGPDGRLVSIRAASRTRWLIPEPEARANGGGRDNFGFAAWACANAAGLAALGPGAHRGIWYGDGIGHNYGLDVRRFALIDTARWNLATLPASLPEAVSLVPVLAECTGKELNETINACLDQLTEHGSTLVPGAAAAGVLAHSAADPRFVFEAAVAVS